MIGTGVLHDRDEKYQELQQEILQLQAQSALHDAWSIDYIIDPVEKCVEDTNNDVVGHILARYAASMEAESDEEEDVQRKIDIPEALGALETLQLYEAQQEDNNASRLHGLRQWRRDLFTRQQKQKKQTSLDMYFTT